MHLMLRYEAAANTRHLACLQVPDLSAVTPG